MKSFLTTLLLFPLLALLFTACDGGFDTPIRGNGQIERSNRIVGTFTQVVLRCSGDVLIRPGKSDTVVVETDENVLPSISVENRDGILTLDVDNGIIVSPTKLTFIVYMEDITQLDIKGSGTFTSEIDTLVSETSIKLNIDGSGSMDLELAAPKVQSNINGSGGIYLYGTANDQEATIDGSGTIDHQYLSGSTGEATINGSGSIKMNVSTTLLATINGSGTIRYLGTPKITTKINGSGSVRPL